MYTMSLNLQNSVSFPQSEIEITDSMLTPQSLCYLIRATKSSSGADGGTEEAEPETEPI